MRVNAINNLKSNYSNVSFAKRQNRVYTPSTVSNFEIDRALDALSARGIALLKQPQQDRDCHINLLKAESEIERKGFQVSCEAKELYETGANILNFVDFSLEEMDAKYVDIVQGPFVYEDARMTVVAQALKDDVNTIQFFEVENGQKSPLYFAKDGKVTSVAINANNSNKGLRADKVYNFENGKLKSYYEDYETDKKGNETKGREFIFEDGKDETSTFVAVYNEGVKTKGGKTSALQSAHLYEGNILECTKIFYPNKLAKANLSMSFIKRSAAIIDKDRKIKQ